MELAFLAPPWCFPPGTPGAGGLPHCPFIGLKFFRAIHVIGCQALAGSSWYTSRCMADPDQRDSHRIQTVLSGLPESGSSSYPYPGCTQTVCRSRRSSSCNRWASQGRTVPLAHPNLQSLIFSRKYSEMKKERLSIPGTGANKRSM